MKNIGVWIDKKEAKIVTVAAENEKLITIKSNIEDYHSKGGSGTKIKGGPQDTVQDSKYLEREKHQLTEFFKDVAKSLTGAEMVVIFGPAQTGEKLQKELTLNHSQFQNLKISVEKSDNMSDNQIKAWVRNYYNSQS